MTRTFSILLIALTLSGCGTLRYVTRDFCELAPDGGPHRKDTPRTQRWFNGYQTLYDRRCPGDLNKWHKNR